VNPISLLASACRHTPQRSCWIDVSSGLTFSDADRLIRSMAGGLERRKVGPRSRVALSAMDSPSLSAAIVACWWRGALPCLVDPRLSADDAGALLERIDAQVFIRSDASRADAPGIDLDDAGWHSDDCSTSVHSDRSPLFCSTTSGTTGPPKLAVLESGPVTLATACIAERAGFTRDDVLLSTTPTSSSFQLVAALLPALHVGAAVTFLAGQPADATRDAAEEGAGTVLLAYPLTLGDVAAGSPVRGLRLAVSGGSPLAPRLKREFRERLGVPLIESYGMSELGGFVALGRPTGGARLDVCVGRPLPDRPVKVVDPETHNECDFNEEGEVVIAEGFMAGYLNDESATLAATHGSVMHTGDVGVIDGDGYLSVRGRLVDKPLVERLGSYPRVWEDALYEHDTVLHAAVLPTDSGLTAFVQPRSGMVVDPKEVLATASQHLAGALVPERLVVVDAMPRTFSGKLDRRALAQHELEQAAST
jgi:long-chain acyl-CoA synthetase